MSYILVDKVVESLRQALPRQLEQSKTQDLMEVQQPVPDAKHHGTC